METERNETKGKSKDDHNRVRPTQLTSNHFTSQNPAKRIEQSAESPILILLVA